MLDLNILEYLQILLRTRKMATCFACSVYLESCGGSIVFCLWLLTNFLTAIDQSPAERFLRQWKTIINWTPMGPSNRRAHTQPFPAAACCSASLSKGVPPSLYWWRREAKAAATSQNIWLPRKVSFNHHWSPQSWIRMKGLRYWCLGDVLKQSERIRTDARCFHIWPEWSESFERELQRAWAKSKTVLRMKWTTQVM